MDARRSRLAAAAVGVTLTVVLGACSSTAKAAPPVGAPSGAAPARPARVLNIVAGENFWGSIVAQLAGAEGNVTSIVTDPNADPHNYETSSADARAMATADYVIVNGAGYDAWAQQLLAGNRNGKRKVLVVADLLGKKEGDNPHFWYDPDDVTLVTDRIEADLKALAPADGAYFDTQRASLDAASAPYRARLAEIKAKFAGTPVASTESIFVYLADYLGLHLISPPDFMNAVAEGNDPPAPAVAQFQDQLAHDQARLLVYNEQTVTRVTTNLKQLAATANIPVVGVTETILPPDASFEQWFEGELEQLQNALNAGALVR